MGQVSSIFQYINDEGEVVEYPRFANIKTISNLVDVINKGKDGLTTAEAVAKTMQLNMWDSYKRKLEIYEDVKTAIEAENAANSDNPEYTPEALPVKPSWSDDDVAHITTDYVLDLPDVKTAIRNKQKQQRQAELDNATVTLDGMVFDADEVSQQRFMFALQVADVTGQTETSWKLNDNEWVTVSVEEMKQVLVLAGAELQRIMEKYG